jgi:hypothetical protein
MGHDVVSSTIRDAVARLLLSDIFDPGRVRERRRETVWVVIDARSGARQAK